MYRGGLQELLQMLHIRPHNAVGKTERKPASLWNKHFVEGTLDTTMENGFQVTILDTKDPER